MAKAFNRDQLLDAFDEIGWAAIGADTRLDIAVFGGSALMLASNFRFATEDVDIAEIGKPWPDWLANAVARISTRNGWLDTWLNDAVTSHLSPLAHPERDLVAFGTFPRTADKVGLTVFVPTPRYLLALKLKALRIGSPVKGGSDFADVRGLLQALGITEIEEAIGVLAEYFPSSAADADKQRFVLKHVLSAQRPTDASRYPRRGD
jgi:hypothetical protein